MDEQSGLFLKKERSSVNSVIRNLIYSLKELMLQLHQVLQVLLQHQMLRIQSMSVQEETSYQVLISDSFMTEYLRMMKTVCPYIIASPVAQR